MSEKKTFRKGDTVVYPLQYVGVIRGIEEITVLGNKEQYYVIDTESMQLKVPVSKTEELGIRSIVSRDDLPDVYEILRAPSKLALSPEGEMWSERYDELKNKIKNGTIIDLAQVVRDLHKNSVLQPLNQMEKELLKRAKKSLLDELDVIEEGLPRKKVQLMLNKLLKENVKRSSRI